jgi:hypothetical protein
MAEISAEDLNALLGEMPTGPEGDRRLAIITVQHLAAATRAHVETSESVAQQLGSMTDRLHELALVITRVEERSAPIDGKVNDHETRLRALEKSGGSREATNRLINWFVANWMSLAAFAAGIFAIFERRS